jgi:phage tail protein X
MPQPKTVTTIQGDMWDTISRRVYGSEIHTAVLMDANQPHRFTTVFSAGAVLVVPDLPATTSERDNLPPWMRGR